MDVIWKTDPLTPSLIEECGPQWQQLAEAAAEKNIYLSSWFVAASLHMSALGAASVLRVYERDDLIGLWIFKDARGLGRLPIPYSQTCLHLHQFQGTPLVWAGKEAAFAQGVAKCLARRPWYKSLFVFSLIPEGSAVYAALKTQAESSPHIIHVLDRRERAAILSSSTPPEDSTAHVSAKRLKPIRQRTRALNALGPTVVEHLTLRADLEPWFNDFLRLENMGWKHDLGTAILQQEDDYTLYKTLIYDAFEHGHVWFSRLVVNDTPIAYTLNFIDDNFVFCQKCSHDPAYRQYGPGILLEFDNMKYYVEADQPYRVDSCTSSDNDMLNALFPDRLTYVTVGIARKNPFYSFVFSLMALIKKWRP